MDANRTPRLLRTKTGTSDDSDWPGLNDVPADADMKNLPPGPVAQPSGMRETWICVLARNASGVLLDRASCTFTATPVEVFARNGAVRGRGGSAADAVVDMEPITGCALNRWYPVPSHGMTRFTVRLSAIAGAPGTTDNLEIWIAPGD